MTTTTSSNGATVDNLNVLDTITADNTGGVQIIELQDVASALFPTTNATQTQTIDTAFWNGQLKLTFQIGSTYASNYTGPYYTLIGTSPNNFTLFLSTLDGNALTGSGAFQTTFSASCASAFLSALSSFSYPCS